MKKLLVLFFAALAIFCATAANAQENPFEDSVLVKMKPLLEDGTLLIAHVDLAKIDVTKALNHNRKALEKMFAELGVPKEKLYGFLNEMEKINGGNIEKNWQELLDNAEAGKKMLTDACGIQDVFFVLQFGKTFPNFFHVAIPKTKKLNIEAVRENLCGNFAITRDMDDYFFIAPSPRKTYFNQELEKTLTDKLGVRQQADRQDILDAYNEVKDYPIKILVAIPPYIKNIVKEIQPKLPENIVRDFPALDSVDIPQLVSGVIYKAVGINPEKGKMITFVQMKSESDAQKITEQIDKICTVASVEFLKYLDALKKRSDLKDEVLDEQESLLVTLYPYILNEKSLAALKSQIVPKPDGKRFTINFDTNEAGKLLSDSGITLAKLVEVSVKVIAVNSKRAKCQNNVKQILIGLHVYLDALNKFPPAFSVDKNGKPLHSWRVLILPYIEQAALYDSIRLDEPWDSDFNKQFHDKMPKVFQCPSCTKGNPISDTVYCMVAGEKSFGHTDGKGLIGSDLKDGFSNTLGITERATPVCWMSPEDIKFDDALKGINKTPNGIGSEHEKGAVVGMLDGNVRFIMQNLDPKVLEALLTTAGGESAEVPKK